jgi:probable glucitol transport protein GutA
LGQNVFYGLVAINMQTFYSDVGITAASIAVILFITKTWDAVNDPLFGILVDKIRFKKGRFLPWLRIATPIIMVSSIVFFALPNGTSPLLKILWATLAYMAFDLSYTLCDVPIFVLPMSMTENTRERGQMLTMGRSFAMIGIVAASVVLPLLQSRIGWFMTGLVLSIIGVLALLPLCFKVKERHIVRPEKEITFKQMFKYIAGNKFLLIFYLSMFIGGITSFGQYVTIFFTRYNLGNQDAAALLSMLALLPLLAIGPILPSIIKHMDKYKLFILCKITAAASGIILYFIGYSNMALFYVFYLILNIFNSANNILLFTFTPDCLEYGTYHTGERAEGVAAAVQTFFSKLVGSIGGPAAMLILAAFGFVAGENAVQPEGVRNGIWLCYSLFPALGIVAQLFVLFFYKLRDTDVQIMTRYNNRQITKGEADEQLKSKYGGAAVLTKMTVTVKEGA